MQTVYKREELVRQSSYQKEFTCDQNLTGILVSSAQLVPREFCVVTPLTPDCRFENASPQEIMYSLKIKIISGSKLSFHSY